MQVRHIGRFLALYHELQCRKISLRIIQPLIASITVDTLQGVIPVVCLAAKSALIYRPRRPRQAPLYKTIERYLPELERTCKRSPAVLHVSL
jgi:hypothetical protein